MDRRRHAARVSSSAERRAQQRQSRSDAEQRVVCDHGRSGRSGSASGYYAIEARRAACGALVAPLQAGRGGDGSDGRSLRGELRRRVRRRDASAAAVRADERRVARSRRERNGVAERRDARRYDPRRLRQSRRRMALALRLGTDASRVHGVLLVGRLRPFERWASELRRSKRQPRRSRSLSAEDRSRVARCAVADGWGRWYGRCRVRAARIA